MFTGTKRPLIYGHRGASAYAPENTLAAFRLALTQGADGIELDAKLSADREVVVIHDQTVDRTTDGRGRVNALELNALKKLDAGAWKGPAFQGETIPTLAEVFETLGGKLIINVELTNYESPDDELVPKVVALVKQYQLENSVLLSSFLPSNLMTAKQMWPEAALGILAHPGRAGRGNRSPSSRQVAPQFLHPYFLDVSHRLVQREKTAGRLVNVWTVNLPLLLRKMIFDEVEGIITDDPLLALKIRSAL